MLLQRVPSKPTLQAIVVMLDPYVPGITPAQLVRALKEFGEEKPEMETAKKPKLYTVKDVQEILGCCEATVYRHFQSGKLKYVKVGSLTRIREAALNDFLTTV